MTNRAAVFRKRNPLTIQAQVIWALIIREIMTRYGRHNIGFLWLFVEPMLFTLGITTLWTIAGFHHGSNLPITAFALTGYSTVLLWRNMPTRCVGAIAPNSSLMYHRNVRVLDIFLSRIALEAIGATMSFVTLGLLFNFLGLMDMPENPLLVVQGWLLTAWFGGSLAMLLGSLSEKSELVEKLASENPHLFQRDVENIVNAILDTIADALARGDRVELRGFGAFSIKKRDARTGRNPRTGESVSISEKVVPVFKTGKEMRQRLNMPEKVLKTAAQ